jgi:hypothetical protein
MVPPLAPRVLGALSRALGMLKRCWVLRGTFRELSKFPERQVNCSLKLKNCPIFVDPKAQAMKPDWYELLVLPFGLPFAPL